MTANYTVQLFQGEQNKLDSIYKESIRIYTGIFRTSPVKSLHITKEE